MGTKVLYKIPTALSTTLPLTGEGEEWVLDVVSGEMIARFWNGNLVSAECLSPHSTLSRLKEEPTLLLQGAA